MFVDFTFRDWALATLFVLAMAVFVWSNLAVFGMLAAGAAAMCSVILGVTALRYRAGGLR
ncbi:hypothetical protein GCM10010210_13080 [Pseudonocardia hydrocarbonoxydans]|uniref:Uncharacterized protein n=1 Tax=Pseudonocardia hydrocarbonoxydans TaxID=76726 RepID=A0A4Y3WQ96_9PSEU|nr:hypothetical protein PHY01_32780 [Pseudonocardia hydrocarbonoxydans]